MRVPARNHKTPAGIIQCVTLWLVATAGGCASASTTAAYDYETSRAFYTRVIDIRAREGLAQETESLQRSGTLHWGGDVSDYASVLLGAMAYGNPVGTMSGDADLKDAAFAVLDRVALGVPTGWGFDLFYLANAVLMWSEVTEVDPGRYAAWREAVERMARAQLGAAAINRMSGLYANPEFMLIGGLAATWKLTGDNRYLDAARTKIRGYDSQLFAMGGMSYLAGSSPQAGYQAIVVAGAARYFELTRDPYARQLIERMVEYYPAEYEPAGHTGAWAPGVLKHNWHQWINPVGAQVIAAFSGDPRNQRIAAIMAARAEDAFHSKWPEYLQGEGRAWLNYEHAALIGFAHRYMKDIPQVPLAEQRILIDRNIRGVRTRSGSWSAGVATRRMQDTLVGAVVTGGSGAVPLDSALGWVLFETQEGALDTERIGTGAHYTPRSHHYMHDPEMAVQMVLGPEMAAVTAHSPALFNYYWQLDHYPHRNPSELRRQASIGVTETWLVVDKRLMGLATARANRDGGGAPGDYARMRWQFLPTGQPLEHKDTGPRRAGRYGSIGFVAEVIAGADWRFGVVDGAMSPPSYADWTLTRYTDRRQLVLQSSKNAWARGEQIHIGMTFFEGVAEGATFGLLQPGVPGAIFETDSTVWLIAANHAQAAAMITLDFPPDAPWSVYRDDQAGAEESGEGPTMLSLRVSESVLVGLPLEQRQAALNLWSEG